MTSGIKNLPRGLQFLVLMIVLYLATGLVRYSYLAAISKNLLKNVVEILPVLFWAFFIVFLVNYFIKPEAIKKHLGHDSGMKGWLYTLLGSILISGPPYVIFPILKELRGHGMKYSLLAAFLNNRNVQPAFLPVMAYYFGLPFTIILSFYVIIFSILTGVIIGQLVKDDLPVQGM
jgi:uncharacterized membrane protein YraQ (UPF0718 family)